MEEYDVQKALGLLNWYMVSRKGPGFLVHGILTVTVYTTSKNAAINYVSKKYKIPENELTAYIRYDIDATEIDTGI